VPCWATGVRTKMGAGRSEPSAPVLGMLPLAQPPRLVPSGTGTRPERLTSRVVTRVSLVPHGGGHAEHAAGESQPRFVQADRPDSAQTARLERNTSAVVARKNFLDDIFLAQGDHCIFRGTLLSGAAREPSSVRGGP
jgi:hypothetical protein